jgi:hypothetical protein
MRAIAVLFTTILLTGCGGGAGEPGASSQPPAAAADAEEDAAVDRSGCELLTDAEVAEATATTVTGHEEASLDGCRWRSEGGTTLMLDVYAGSTLSPATCGAQKALGVGREEAVEGLGDSALWKTSGSLVVCSARAVIRFNLDNSKRSVPEDEQGVIALARLALDRL